VRRSTLRHLFDAVPAPASRKPGPGHQTCTGLPVMKPPYVNRVETCGGQAPACAHFILPGPGRD
jgi:hypothetical protein